MLTLPDIKSFLKNKDKFNAIITDCINNVISYKFGWYNVLGDTKTYWIINTLLIDNDNMSKPLNNFLKDHILNKRTVLIKEMLK